MARSAYLSAMLGLALGAAVADPLCAQQPSNSNQLVYQMARNKVGLLRYCKREGLLDAATADRAIQGAEGAVAFITSFLNTPVNEEEGNRAEKNGEDGLWGTLKIPLAKWATSLDQVPVQACKEWAAQQANSPIVVPAR